MGSAGPHWAVVGRLGTACDSRACENLMLGRDGSRWTQFPAAAYAGLIAGNCWSERRLTRHSYSRNHPHLLSSPRHQTAFVPYKSIAYYRFKGPCSGPDLFKMGANSIQNRSTWLILFGVRDHCYVQTDAQRGCSAGRFAGNYSVLSPCYPHRSQARTADRSHSRCPTQFAAGCFYLLAYNPVYAPINSSIGA